MPSYGSAQSIASQRWAEEGGDDQKHGGSPICGQRVRFGSTAEILRLLERVSFTPASRPIRQLDRSSLLCQLPTSRDPRLTSAVEPSQSPSLGDGARPIADQQSGFQKAHRGSGALRRWRGRQSCWTIPVIIGFRCFNRSFRCGLKGFRVMDDATYAELALAYDKGDLAPFIGS